MQKILLVILYLALTIFDMTLLVHFFNNLINSFHFIDFIFLLLNAYLIISNVYYIYKLLFL